LKKGALSFIFNLLLIAILTPLIITGNDRTTNESPVFASKQINPATDGLSCSDEYITGTANWTFSKVPEKPLFNVKIKDHHSGHYYEYCRTGFVVNNDFTSNCNNNFTTLLKTVVLRI
jgi:hypothetical protein